MGATESISIPAEEAGALSPEQQVAESQEQPTEQSSDKPEWLRWEVLKMKALKLERI